VFDKAKQGLTGEAREPSLEGRNALAYLGRYPWLPASIGPGAGAALPDEVLGWPFTVVMIAPVTSRPAQSKQQVLELS